LSLIPNEYYFRNQSVIVAYVDAEFAGLLVADSGESFAKYELLDYFRDEGVKANLLIAIDPKLSEEIEPDRLRTQLDELIQRLTSSSPHDLTDLDILYYIPRYLH
jgi:hypothetical protein